MAKVLFVSGLLLLFITGCTSETVKNKSIIRIKGSDTMLILVRQFAEAYMTVNPGTAVYVEGGGSGTGFEALIAGEADIAMSSRLINPQEALRMSQTYKSIGLSYLIANDALSVYLNPANKIETLTMGDLDLIFSGQIKDWLVFTNLNSKIIPVIRPSTSGTHLHFKRHVLKGKDYSPSSLILPTTAEIARNVLKNKNAIGYGGFAYGDSVFRAPVNGVYPTPENVRDGDYPLSRYLYFYTIDIPDSRIKDFIDWVISPAGQRIVKHVGYVPLWD